MKIQPWLAPAPAADSVDDFLVVGAGVAGAAIARALAERGSRVRVLDKQAPASSASGNPAAVIRPVLARSLDDPLARFYSDAFAATKSRILALVQEGHAIAHAFDGVLHCHPQAEALLGAVTHEYWTLENAQAQLGDSARAGGCWLPEAGWVSPRHYTNALLAHPSIELMLGQLATLDHDGLRWRLFDSEGSCLASAENVVLANGWQLTQLAPAEFLPVYPVVSQLLHFQAQHSRAGPAVPVVGGGTISPSAEGWMATAGHWHDTTDDNVEVGRNPEILQRCSGVWRMPALAGDANLRAAVRGASRDYLPVVGGVPYSAQCRELYDDLRHGRPAHHYPEPPYLPGLYVLGALGGRGITSAQFCAEVLCATVFGEEHPWQLGLHPLRFMARDLKHGHAKS